MPAERLRSARQELTDYVETLGELTTREVDILSLCGNLAAAIRSVYVDMPPDQQAEAAWSKYSGGGSSDESIPSYRLFKAGWDGACAAIDEAESA